MSRAPAHVKARQLLEEHLTPQQLATFRQYNWFIVRSRAGGRFVIKTDIDASYGNVGVLDARGCVSDVLNFTLSPSHRHGPYPPGDIYLAQKLALENDLHRVRKLSCHMCAIPKFVGSGPYKDD